MALACAREGASLVLNGTSEAALAATTEVALTAVPGALDVLS